MALRHAVISGAGIAGPALAHELNRRGWRTTIAEKYPELREEGQNVDIRGAAREVIARMGIRDRVRAAGTGEVGMRFVRQDGSVAAVFPASRSGGADGPTADLEILRGRLSRILYERTRDDTEYRFGTRICDVADHGDGVSIIFDDGDTIDADVLVIAEGLRSRSRRWVTSAEVADFGMYFGYLTIPRLDSDDRWWNWTHVPQSRAVHLRPDNVGTTRAILTFASQVRGLEAVDRQAQNTILRATFADVGGPCPRVLAELDDAALYLDAVGQFHSPAWVKGRAALIGDAAFCNATFGGAGTSLALIGAYVLAGELATTDNPRDALQSYERVMRPIAGTAPKVRAGMLRRANPATSIGIRALHTAAGIVATPAVQSLMHRLGAGHVNVAEKITLPTYGDDPCLSEAPHYRPPPRWQKLVSALLVRINIAQRLTVSGRRTGAKRHVAISTVELGGITYLVSARGDSQWVKNVRHNPHVVVTVNGRSREYTATEIPTDQRAPILAAKFGSRRRRRFTTASPDPAHHPVFALNASDETHITKD